jgi:4-amino-4-deoxy-L-arabinose transferase-like glycosyltransferase
MKQYFMLALIVVAGVVPFSSRAVFMDEHIFLKIAKNAQQNWAFPQDTPGMFFGIPLENFAAHTHPPAGEYYLAFIFKLLGRFSEVPFRLLFSIFSIATVLAFYFLARRFTEEPFHATVLFAVTPAFFVMTPTLMMDIPMLAFLLSGMAFYYAHLEGKRFALISAAICFVLAAGTGYTALVPLMCLFVQILFTTRSRNELLAVLSAPLALVVWQVLMRVHFGELPLNDMIAFYADNGGVVGHNLAATLSFLGTVTLFPGTALIVSSGRTRRIVFASIVFAAVPAMILTFSGGWLRLWYFVAAISGLMLFLAFTVASRRIIASEKNRGEALFILWVPAALLFFIIVADMINARYILLAVPALYLVLLRNSNRRQLTIALIPTAVLSISVAYADFTFVNAYREWVRETVVPLQQRGFRVWSAAESGLRFYLEEEGVAALSAVDMLPKGADLVVRHDLFHYGLSEQVETMLTSVNRYSLNSGFPIRTFNTHSGAGFHDSRIGLTPFALSWEPLDRVEISQISPFVKGLPQQGIPAEEIPAWSPRGVILKQTVDRLEFKMKIPANSKLEYEVDGKGAAELAADKVILRRSSPGTIVWRNFRLVPF